MSLKQEGDITFRVMQNAGAPGALTEEELIDKIDHQEVTLIVSNGAILTNPDGFTRKVSLFPNEASIPTDEEEAQVLAETTL